MAVGQAVPDESCSNAAPGTCAQGPATPTTPADLGVVGCRPAQKALLRVDARRACRRRRQPGIQLLGLPLVHLSTVFVAYCLPASHLCITSMCGVLRQPAAGQVVMGRTRTSRATRHGSGALPYAPLCCMRLWPVTMRCRRRRVCRTR